jgi:aryl-phospho-beta-D-glucosidase BglC (GH1 family)
MHKISALVDKAKHRISAELGHAGPPQFAVHNSAFPTERDIYRLRKQRGVNLGSWFVLEKWIADYPFAHTQGSSDLDVARAPEAKQILERHWDAWMVEEDWIYLASKGINTVRIPIGFYHICGADPSVLDGTDFKDYRHVFEGAWSRITNALSVAYRYEIGIVIDLHAAPGKQNGDSHAGAPGPALFFKHKANMERTTHILVSLLRHLSAYTHEHNLPNLVGLELVNEPAPAGQNDLLEDWYRTTSVKLREVDRTIQLLLGDSWWTDHYVGVANRVAGAAGAPIVLDHHLYRCFTAEDGQTPASEHARRLREHNAAGLASAAEKLEDAGGGLVVAEWSGALNPGSTQGVDVHRAQREFVDAQLALYERVCAGWFFWTFKKQRPGDSGWGWRDALANNVFPHWVGLKLARLVDVEQSHRRRNACRDKALEQHTNWWKQYPGHYEHWRFSIGYEKGWDDAYRFFTTASVGHTIPEIGFKGTLAKARAEEHVREKGSSNIWEFEHGFKQGISGAREDIAKTCC